ncbi:hypothetical protein ACGFWI_04965 [Streptomyces sp. NPDC048434]|jgi:hypothetical protein
MTAPGPKVGDDMLAGLALSALNDARADQLLVRDEDRRTLGVIALAC